MNDVFPSDFYQRFNDCERQCGFFPFRYQNIFISRVKEREQQEREKVGKKRCLSLSFNEIMFNFWGLPLKEFIEIENCAWARDVADAH